MLEDLLLRPLLTFLFKLCFRIEVRGLENYHAAGDRVLIIANHQSYLDPPLLGTFLPEKPAYAINVFQADKPMFRWLNKLVTLYKLDPSKPLSMKRLIQDMRQGAKVVVFPEGRITTSGGIMKIYEGTSMIIEKTGATVLPVHISGAEYSKVSRLERHVRQRWFPKITLTILPPVKFAPGEATSRAIYDVMTEAAFAAMHYRRSLLEALLEAESWHGPKHVIASDIMRIDMNYRQLLMRAFVLAAKLPLPLGEGRGEGIAAVSASQHTVPPSSGTARHLLPKGEGKYIALMLPNGLGALVTFFALHILGKIPCMLNYSAGAMNLLHACRVARVKTVLTSRQFVEKGKLEHLIDALQKEYAIVYLEDIRSNITLKDKLAGFWKARQPRAHLYHVLNATRPDDPAVILYTSGSEGVPKGVALSHTNLLSNMAQARARLDLMPSDILFNALPVFHSFGLTVGMLLPVLAGIKTFLYPSPLHYRVIPDLVYDTDATIMLGTDTFYQGYARYAHPYDFWNIRLAVAGAEKLKESTRQLYLDRFGISIMQGYGVTEASPVISCNTPMGNKPGTVGRLFPAIESRLEKVAGLERGGRLFVHGPNIMLGYLKADRPGEIQPHGEWYDTGDIVDIDAEGFITILGRAKRFAKIGGEMVSLVVAEELAAALWPEQAHAAMAVPDPRKGEHIVLYTEAKELSQNDLLRQAKAVGVADICLPHRVVYLEIIPRLGSGKIDYMALKEKITG